jgi:dephospho-CoA kinase
MGLVIGLLGGVASGKSTVARLMERRGLVRVDADAIARRVVQQPAVLQALTERFGKDLLDGSGALDRALLAERAFSSASSTEALNALVHPAVRLQIQAELDAAVDRSVVLDVPLLLESPLAEAVTHWVFIESDAGRRDARAVGRDWGPDERRQREERQASLEDKRQAADHFLENNGDIDDLEARVDRLLQGLGLNP